VSQIGASIVGAIGTKRAPLYHSRRGRNLWLFLFAIGVFGCFWVQIKLIFYTEAEYLNRDQYVRARKHYSLVTLFIYVLYQPSPLFSNNVTAL
jgi:hypothetical protein